MAQFGTIRGDSGEVLVTQGAKAGIISRWKIEPSGGTKPDGTQILRFRCGFSWVSESLMNLRFNGRDVTKRVRIKMRTPRHGLEDVDIIGWDSWRYEDGILTLENIVHAEGVRERKVSAPTFKRV